MVTTDPEPVFVWCEIYKLSFQYGDAEGDRFLFAEVQKSFKMPSRYMVTIGGEYQCTHTTRAEAVRWVEERFRASAGLPPTTMTTPLGGIKP